MLLALAGDFGDGEGGKPRFVIVKDLELTIGWMDFRCFTQLWLLVFFFFFFLIEVK
jgi:hypothetical protein